MRQLQRKIETLLLAERENWLLWVPVAMGIGITLYFYLPREPHFFAAGAVITATIPALWRWKRWPWARGALLICLAIAIGFGAAQWKRARVDAPIVVKDVRVATVSGYLKEIIEKEAGMKLVIAQPVIEGFPAEKTPRNIRLSLRKADRNLQVGQHIRLRGGMFPLPTPAIPGGFDFVRHFYFSEIGAVGYGLAPVEILRPAEVASWRDHITAWRQQLSQKARDEVQGLAGPVAAALMTGERGAISDEVKEAMRSSGLAHMLAISGLHLGLVTGVLFILSRYMLLLVPQLTLRTSIKKWAAISALVGGLGYLAMSGFAVSAQRAYLMVALVLTAVILDRRVHPMRSLALAAIVILLIAPESLLSPSFQLSFTATIAILAFSETVLRYRTKRPWLRESWFYKPLLYLGGSMAISFVAGAATTPYTIFHFNQVTAWHVLANVLASPILSLLVMPSAVLATFSMPFGLEGIFFWLMQQGIEWIIAIAFWVTSLPYAMSYAPTMPDWGIGFVSLGGLWLCFWRQRWRWWGVPLITIGCLSLLFVKMPDILISEKAEQVALRQQDGHYAMLQGSMRNFNARSWQDALGIDSWTKPDAVEDYHCDALGCVYQHGALAIALPQYSQTAQEDCGKADAMITSFYHDCDSGVVVERPKMPVALYFADGDMHIRHTTSYLQRIMQK